jgi:N-acetylglutamate synthase/N-acetylornithine aminotransferase
MLAKNACYGKDSNWGQGARGEQKDEGRKDERKRELCF